ncbi:tetratricopeptide repeat protein [Leptolyngbya sp. GB1-A1]|uniref:tetratricopeptide repeat protein n=1 Tax=Leptolyngbya sp. GB1-A1 TaxID=2933908 RepID=UPI003299F3B7
MAVPYILRPQAEAFLQAFANAVQQPQQSPVVFHIWGVGGVGKTTLTRKLKEAHREKAFTAEVSFGLTEGIDDPIGLMTRLYEQIASQDSWHDPFWEKHELYQETLHQLKTESPDGKGKVGEEQIKYIKQLTNLGVDVAGELFLGESAKKTASTIADRGIDAAVAALSLKDDLVQFLKQHRATKRDKQLQELMLEPLPKLTKAFAEGLSQKAKQQPVILVLDTYEKVPSPIDLWLWRSLIGNTDISQHRVRLIVSGRHCILKGEGWRKLSQDRFAVQQQEIKRFTTEQTQTYLEQIGVEDFEQIQNIHRVTKGLPYYLNWIREQYLKGQKLDFAQGNQEIVRLLLQGLNNTQKQVVQIAACCLSFDRKLIQYLIQQQNLDFETAVDSQQNCFEWLVQNTFVVPVQHEFRLDDVARDVFRLSLWQEDRDRFESVHNALAQYFEASSDREVSPTAPPPDKYENADWLIPRFQFLYYLLFTRRQDVQPQLITHLLEARYFNIDRFLVQAPVNLTEAEYKLSEHPLLNHATRQFLTRIRPAINYGWAVLEEYPIDYPYNLEKYGLSKVDTDRAIEQCLTQVDRLAGLAKFMALFCKSRRCPASESYGWLMQAKEEAEHVVTPTHGEFSSNLFLWKIANALFELERYEEAIDCYEKAIEYKPDKHAAWNNRGIALANLERYEEAIVSWNKALEHKPDAHQAWNNRGIALANLGQYKEAIVSWDKAIEYKPDKHAAWNNRGFALANLGQYKEAIGSWDKALELKPDDDAAWNNRGLALVNLGHYEEAIGSYEKALEYKPDDYAAWYNKGNALFNLERYEEAIDSYEKALEYKPDDDESWYNKAYCYSLWNHVDEAIESLQRAIELNPGYREKAKTDSDLDNIRSDDRFKALIEEDSDSA